MSIVRLLGGGALCCLFVLVGAGAAHAVDLVIPIDTVIESGVSDGEMVELAAVSSGALAGTTCTVRSVHRVDGEPHPGNDLMVSSNNERIVLADVERESGAVTDGSDLLVIDELITVELVMGPSEVFGGAVDVELDCQSSPTETETQPPTEETPRPPPAELAATGTATIGLVLVAALLVAAGVGLVALEQRSRFGSDAS